MLCVQGLFNLKCLSIKFLIPNLNQVYFSLPETFKTNVSNRFLSTKSPFEFVFLCCEFKKVIVQSKSWCEMFVFKISDLQNVYIPDRSCSFQSFNGFQIQIKSFLYPRLKYKCVIRMIYILRSMDFIILYFLRENVHTCRIIFKIIISVCRNYIIKKTQFIIKNSVYRLAKTGLN